MFKEDPNMAAISRARAFQERWYIQLLACIEKRAGVIRPCFLIEIHGKKPTGLVFQERVRARLLAEGSFYLVQTRLRGHVHLRVTLINPLTTESDLQALLDAIRRAAAG